MSHSADRNLLFGMFALQNDHITQDQLIAAFQTWILRKDQSLDSLIFDKGWMTEADIASVNSLLDRRIAKVGGEQNLLKNLPANDGVLYRLSMKAADHDLLNSVSVVSEVFTHTQNKLNLILYTKDNAYVNSPPPLQTTDPPYLNSTNSVHKQFETNYEQTEPTDPMATVTGKQAEDKKQSLRYETVFDFYAKADYLAEGAMGYVFQAEDREFGRKVALKQVKSRPGSRADQLAHSSFFLEGEVTGRLDHPGVLPMYGLGRTPDGLPFYAMKYIGSPKFTSLIDDFHAAETRPGRDSSQSNQEFRNLLNHLRSASLTMQYAHDSGVLHCDIKPDNIMTGEYGETYVVDWGLALLHNSKLESENDFTQSASIRMHPVSPKRADSREALHRDQGGSRDYIGGSPAYMSPEHHRCSSSGDLSDMTPACDIFALGVTLYQILTGIVPVYAVKDEERHRRFARMQFADYAPPRSVKSTIPRSLEAICLKAIARKPEDRYVSALAMADDLEKWLAGEPVSAYRENFQESSRRWAKKNRSAVTALASALIILAFGSLLIAINENKHNLALKIQRDEANTQRDIADNEHQKADIQRLEAERQKQEADRQRKVAQANEQTAQFTTKFMVNLFQAADPVGFDGVVYRNSKKQTELTVKEVLERGAEKVKTEFRGKPQIRAQILKSIGQSLREISEFEKAELLLTENLQIVNATSSDNKPLLSDANAQLGRLYHFWARYEMAEPFYLKAIEMLGGLSGDLVEETRAKLMFYIGWFYADQIETRKAENYFQKSLDIYHKLLAKNVNDSHIIREMTIAKLGLSACNFDNGKVLQGVKEIGSILPELLKSTTESNIKAVGAFQSGLVADSLGFQSRAESAYLSALDLSKQNIGLDHPYVAFVYYHLAQVQEKLNKFDEAEMNFRICYDLVKKSVTLAHPRVVYLSRAYSAFLDRRGNPDTASAIQDEVINYRIKTLGPENIRVADAIAAKSFYLFDKSKDQQADILLQQALDIYEKKNPGRSSFILNLVLEKYAWRAYNHGDFRKSIDYFEKTRKIYEEKDATSTSKSLIMRDGIAAAYAHLGEFDKCDTLSQENLKIVEGSNKPDDISIVYATMGMSNRFQGKWQESLDYYKRAASAIENQTSTGLRMDRIDYLVEIAKLHAELGQFAESRIAIEALNKIQANLIANSKPDKLLISSNQIIDNGLLEIKLLLADGKVSESANLLSKLLDKYANTKFVNEKRILLEAMALQPGPMTQQDINTFKMIVDSLNSVDSLKNNLFHVSLVALGLVRAGQAETALATISSVKTIPGSEGEAIVWLVMSKCNFILRNEAKGNELRTKAMNWYQSEKNLVDKNGKIKHNWISKSLFLIIDYNKE